MTQTFDLKDESVFGKMGADDHPGSGLPLSSKYKEVLVDDARQLRESARVRLPCEKLDSTTIEKYQRHVLPRENTEFTTRYQCLKLEKSDSEDYLTYTGRVNEFCEKAKIHELDSGGIKCLLWIELHRECEKFLSLKRDSDTVAGNVEVVEETRKVEKKPVLEKSDSKDYLTYTGRVNEFCEKAKIHELDSGGIKCLLWIV
ncbi:unnamed protein product [Heligmosomoides polygyrus]|uniref:Protein polybromo-1 n=1 Tax=Heligmosomoides polygyrus TaxID=6339 RepID=A0A183G914_HELPZ|nr:unnamed protein product [Heligmosomoides polygyrus]